VKAFVAAGYLLRNARVEVRIAYTAFLLLTSIGLVTTAGFQLLHVGPTPGHVAAYYRGGERAGEMLFGKTARQLLEVTHFHAFSMAIVYLIMAHLVIATGASDRTKRVAVVAGAAGLAGDVGGPWLVRYVAPGFAWLLVAAWAAEWAAFAAFVWCPLREMWFSDGRRTLPPE
jgi:hypothetical protein